MISVRPLSEFLAEKAADELNEDPSRIASDLKYLKNWISKQPHLIAKTDDQFLLAFLRGCKHSLERSKEKLESYYTLRTALPEFFLSRDPTHPAFVEHFHKGIACPLPIPHSKGFRVIFCKPGVYDPFRYNFIDLLKWSLLVVDRNFPDDDNFSVGGNAVICDMQGYTLTHISQTTLPILKKVAELAKAGYPVRHNGIHFLNFPSGVESLVQVVKGFLPAKLAKLMFFHSNLESLYKYIPKNILPAEYGGETSMEEITRNFAEIKLSDKKWFVEDSKYKSDESKRRGPAKTVNELFGMDGSFRKLNID